MIFRDVPIRNATRLCVGVDTRRTMRTHYNTYHANTRARARAFDRKSRTCATHDLYAFRFIVKSITVDIVREQIAVEENGSVKRRRGKGIGKEKVDRKHR